MTLHRDGRTPPRPRVSLHPASLRRVGVTVAGLPGRVWLTCDWCGAAWSPNLLTGGCLPRGWWRCPTGCNQDAALAARWAARQGLPESPEAGR